MSRVLSFIDSICGGRELPDEEFARELVFLINNISDEERKILRERARLLAEKTFGGKVYVRGLVEFTNHCKNNCFYCGLRKGNAALERYRLSPQEIFDCCKAGHELGFRTFVLQGGEDDFYSAEDIARIVEKIKGGFPDCAVTLSVGERSGDDYALWKKAGADRYLLRHESADKEHYSKLKPPELSFENRVRCLRDLKALGYQTGAGFMVGSPFQSAECLAKDILFVKNFQPQMIGIGPFIPHAKTPFHNFAAGSVETTLDMVALARLVCPRALIPATTALATADPKGREKALLSGANVVMPNLSPLSVRQKYALYDGKVCMREEAAECLECLKRRLASVGREIVVDRGDFPS